MKPFLLSILTLLSLLPIAAQAQTNLRGWHANGQTWLVWTDNQTFTKAETYNIHVSGAPITSLASAPLTGRLFPADWKATRLRRANTGLRWTIPDGAGGAYTLATNEAMFVYTPHTAAPEYFAVVKSGNTSVTAGVNSLANPVAQTLDPVTCHLQNTGTDAPSGQTFRDYAFWLDGRADHTANRADFPVMGNANFNGVACLFRVFDPPGGPLPDPMPAVLVLHGHGGSWMSGGPAPSATYMNRHLDAGLVVNLDDHQFSYDATNVTGDGPGVVDSETRWFGYATIFDRFSDQPRTLLPDGSLVVPYTLRRNAWLVDWLVANVNADPHRVALMGHSMGAAGVSLNARFAPEKFCAATAFEGPTVPTDNDLGTYMQGNQAQNLPTAELGGLGVTQVYSPTSQLSTQDLPLMNYVWGVNDTIVVWTGKPTVINNLDATLRGHRLWWDERGHNPPWAGHWVGSTRLTAQNLVGFRNDQSFPAFSADTQPDNNPSVANPKNNAAKNWGVKNGYYDWETSTISDTPQAWSATIFLTGTSSFANDAPAFPTATANVSIRRAQHFKPPGSATLDWSLRRVSDGALLQSGTATSVSDLVTLTNLTFFQDPVRCRLEVTYPAALALKLTLTSRDDSGLATLSAEGLAETSAILQTSPDLTTWSDAQTITFTGPPQTLTHQEPPAETSRFFRLLLLP